MNMYYAFLVVHHLVIGFKQGTVFTFEGMSTLDDLQVMFLSGSNAKFLDIVDVLVTIQLSDESTAIQGIICWECTTMYLLILHKFSILLSKRIFLP